MNGEIRQDIVSGDWIVFALERGKRPHQFKQKRTDFKPPSKDGCPFEGIGLEGNADPILVYPSLDVSGRFYEWSRNQWKIQVIPNKYPVVSHHNHGFQRRERGPYEIIPAVGRHDLVITRDHNKNFPKLNKEEALLVFKAFRDRYLMLLDNEEVAYVAIFHNWGPRAGASIYHPHYQIIAIPVIPPDIKRSVEGSLRYFEKHGESVHQVMLDWEIEERVRIVYENKGAVVVAPFVSKEPFEMRIFPKKHLPYFENTPDEDMKDVVLALQKTLMRVEEKLAADYNFFIHTAPIKNRNEHGHYHWHIEVVPKLEEDAGFELGTGIQINTVDPDEAAKFFRGR